MKATGSWVIVCRRTIPERKVGHIIIPSMGEDNFFEGVVVSVGDSVGESSTLAKGDYVLVRNDNSKIEVGASKAGKIYAVDSFDVICIVDEDEDSDE